MGEPASTVQKSPGLRVLVSKDGLHPGLQGFRQRNASLGIIEIRHLAEVSKIKRDVGGVLSNQNDSSP